MSDESHYHQHIEQAIQNVLSKVKHPGRLNRAASTPAPSAQSRTPKSRTPQQSKLSPPVKTKTAASTTQTEAASVPSAPKKLTSPLEDLKTREANTEGPVYLEAEDLYTPMPLEEEVEQEEPENEELPLIEDSYQAPYNIFEEFVETELNILLSRYLDICRCAQCRSDMVALALQQLPAYYVTGTRGTLTAKSVIWTRYMQQIMDAVTKAIHIVYKRPRSNCRKIKQVLWVRPDLEDIGSTPRPEQEQPLFGDIHDEELELEFSKEIEEIIQTLEQAPAADKAELLPVSSPVVQKSYAPYQSQVPHFETPVSEEDSVDMQLLDIDDWEEQEQSPQS